MLSINPPAQPPAAVLSICLSGVAVAGLAARLNAIEPVLVATAASYHQHAQAATLHLIPRALSVGAVTKDELKGLYTGQMSSSAGAARSVYNAIRSLAKNDKCPLCGIGTVKVLDHHLPSSKYPDLAVCPLNLVPACEFCNNSKRATFPETAGQQTLHPYYDDLSQNQWISARLEKVVSPALVFYVDPPMHWTQISCDRARRHFDVVSLGHSFTSNANDELITLRDHLERLRAAGGTTAVHAYLDGETRRHCGRLNSWQHVTYRTLAADTWFVNGGHSLIPA